MADAKQLKKAKEVLDIIRNSLDGIKWHYDVDESEENPIVHFSVTGEDIPMEFIIVIDAKRQLIRLLSLLPFTAGEDKITAMAVATSYVNYKIADGSFDFSVENGRIVFRQTSSYRESLISSELIMYMVQCACYTVDKYNDKFLAICNGGMSVEEFVKAN